MTADGNKGINKLARTIHSRIKSCENKELVLDFGRIDSTWALVTNTYPIPIPQSDYLILRDIRRNESTEEHVVSIGDRVLVAWVQNDPVVLDMILPGSAL